MKINKSPFRTISGIGEFAFIKNIVAASRRDMSRRGLPRGVTAVVANGDDAAILAVKPSRSRECLAVSADMLVEGVHFDTSLMSFYEIGMKAVVANISDMAAMGGASPISCVVCLSIPVDINVENVDKLLDGMRFAAAKSGFTLIGGDTVRSPKNIVISVTIFGTIARGHIIKRGGAKAGDLICVTGAFGDSSAGLDVLSRGRRRLSRDIYGHLVRAYRRPGHRLKEAMALSGSPSRPSALMDSSDGLAACVRAISSASGTRARVFLENVPLSGPFMAWAATDRKSKKFPWRNVLEGGEEYELVFTAPPKNIAALAKRARFSVVGEMTSGRGAEYFLYGKKLEGDWRGYENF